MIFRCLRPIWLLIKAVVLITLPVTLFPAINGLFEGFFLGDYILKNGQETQEAIVENIQSARWMDWFSVPGGPGIHDTGLAPYYVVEFRDPTNWWEKLGLKRFDVDMKNYPPFGFETLAELASLDRLYKREGKSGNTEPWHHWIYASNQPFRMEGLYLDGWDEAFNELVQYTYAHQASTSSKFHQLTCPTNFLCKAWKVEGPALIHLTTEIPPEMDEELYYESMGIPTFPGYQPVAVRIIELPLSGPEQLDRPRVFPSYFNQMRALTDNNTLWASHDPYHGLTQLFRRHEEICKDRYLKNRQTYRRTRDIEQFLLRNLGFEEAMLPELVRLMTTTFSVVTRVFSHRAWNAVFASSPEPEVENAEPEAPLLGKRDHVEDNFMAQGVRDMFDSMDEDVEELLRSTPEGSEALERIWELVRRKSSSPNEEDEESE